MGWILVVFHLSDHSWALFTQDRSQADPTRSWNGPRQFTRDCSVYEHQTKWDRSVMVRYWKEVAVLDKAIEYQVVVKEKSKPKVFDQIDDAIKAVKSDEVDGMLLDYYTADYYRQMDKFKSLFTASKFFEDVQVGFLLSKNITNRTSRCGLGDIEEYLDLEYWFEEVAIDYDYDPEPSFSLFEVSAPFVRKFLYLSLGILGLMIIIGIVWETCKRRSTDAKEKMELVSVCVEKLDVAKGIEREAMRGNIDETKKLLQEVQEQLVKLESSVLQVFEKLETEELEGKKQINDKRS